MIDTKETYPHLRDEVEDRGYVILKGFLEPEVVQQARAELETTGQRTILFVDELHRFNRAQQDVLLPDVEEGRVILIGATTQNAVCTVVIGAPARGARCLRGSSCRPGRADQELSRTTPSIRFATSSQRSEISSSCS